MERERLDMDKLTPDGMESMDPKVEKRGIVDDGMEAETPAQARKGLEPDGMEVEDAPENRQILSRTVWKWKIPHGTRRHNT
ncbi:hypothetical protein A6M23_07840 [Acidithiobacillus thiooxidans]|uniref:Uncharacterized protein n=1 Tax=Acidithiobacillus thiooxidans TaxID=930 RepID=A0A1C2ICC1_ACITH|nr:hypothetical protein A6M23_07840 [Acidithiobacillus thiooxidans]